MPLSCIRASALYATNSTLRVLFDCVHIQPKGRPPLDAGGKGHRDMRDSGQFEEAVLSINDDGQEERIAGGRRLRARFVAVGRFLVRPATLLTAGYCASFAALGLVLAALGPLLLDLGAHPETERPFAYSGPFAGKQTGSTVAEMGYVFAARSMGYLVGSAIGGPLVDRFNGHVLLSGTLIVLGSATATIPVITSVWLLAAAVSIQVPRLSPSPLPPVSATYDPQERMSYTRAWGWEC